MRRWQTVWSVILLGLASVASLMLTLGVSGARPAGAARSIAGVDDQSGPTLVSSTGKIAYVFQSDTAPNDQANMAFLNSRGYTVTPVLLSFVSSTDFSPFDLIMIGEGTGTLNEWGTVAADVPAIIAPNKPIMGLSEGGYAFFGKLSLFIGWPRGWHSTDLVMTRVLTAPNAMFTTPNLVSGSPITAYTQNITEVAIYLAAKPADVVAFAEETPSTNHAMLISQGCRYLWGFGGSPLIMTAAGQNLFQNTVEYALHSNCPPPPPLPTGECVTISKASAPAGNTPVMPGDTIHYTLTLLLKNILSCQNQTGLVIDRVPTDTLVISNSLGQGGYLAQDNAVVWQVSPAAAPFTRTFSVNVSLLSCLHTPLVINAATLGLTNTVSVKSNVVQHPVICPTTIFNIYLPLSLK
ncbi:MAG TPA: hypothetical protein VFF70_12800 [Anaerolineae bacterium]|nr:hypothetical protein [Anaerolineae bacterium]